MNPKNAWLWAGTNWEKDINKNLVDVLSGVVLQSDDPEQLCMQWEKALGIKRTTDELKIQLVESTIADTYDANNIGFVPDITGTIPCYERNKNLIITVKSKHPSPATIVSYQWEGKYTNRSYTRV